MSRPNRSIPPLNALRFFEAAARHGSFARAADELSVTPAAVSRQVKQLEDYIGAEFFEREPGGVVLTPQARSYAASLTHALDQIAQATDDFRTRQTTTILMVRGYTTFLVRWLVPRLPDFQQKHPHIRVRMAGGSLGGGLRADADIVIRYGGPHWPGQRAVHLFDDELVPVCSPSFATRYGTDALSWSPQRIAQLPLLALEARRDDWSDWLAQAHPAADGKDLPLLHCQTFEDLAIVHECALRGLGIALAQRRYIEDEIDAGTLVVVSPLVLRRDRGYWALADAANAGRAKVDAFMTWIESLGTTAPGKES